MTGAAKYGSSLRQVDHVHTSAGFGWRYHRTYYVETGLSYDTVWHIMHKQLPATYRRKKKSNEKSSFDTLPYKSLSYRNQIREMDFSAGLRRRLSRTVRTLEGARIAPGNFKNRLAGKHMATRQHLGWILCRALLP